MCMTTDDKEDECEPQYQNDLDVCRALGRRGLGSRASRCYDAAIKRKYACDNGLPLPPLHGWN